MRLTQFSTDIGFMTEEQKLNRWVSGMFQDAHIQRIESSTNPGIPDLNICLNGKEFWIESKILVSGRVLLRKEQFAWGLKRASHGGKIFVLATINRSDFLLWQFPNITVDIWSKYLRIVNNPEFLEPQQVRNFIVTSLNQ